MLVHALAAAAALAAAPPSAAPLAQPLPGPRVGQPAPDFALTTVDGRRVALRDFRGRTLVLNVWGSWCPPCRLEQPDLVAEAAAGRGRVAFLGVDTTETPQVVRAFAAAHGVTYPEVATTVDAPFARAYAITNYPTTVVIDPNGIVRAVHLDNLLPRAQLRAFIAAAERGTSAPLVSEEQRKLDAALDPAAHPMTGDRAAVLAGVNGALQAIAATDDELDDAMTDAARDHDYARTKEEQQTLRERAIAALAPVATTDAERALLARLRGDAAFAAGDVAAAEDAYRAALALAPDDPAALAGDAAVANRRGDAARALADDERIARARPGRETWTAVARQAARVPDAAAAEDALTRAHEAARADAARAPHDAAALRGLAWTDLYDARTQVALGRLDRAQAMYDAALEDARRLPRSDARYAMYVEQAEEGRVALGLARGARPSLAIAPWTGPDLPGSLPSTLKYRVVVTGRAGTAVALRASGLPRPWIGSFCSDRVCQPFGVAVTLPASGVKIVEFQVVPPDARHAALRVRIDANLGGRTAASVVTRVVT